MYYIPLVIFICLLMPTTSYREMSYHITQLLCSIHDHLDRSTKKNRVCDAIEKAFQEEQLPYTRGSIISVFNGDTRIGARKIDFIIDRRVLLQIISKKYTKKTDHHELTYALNQTNLPLGILANFKEKKLMPKRLFNTSGIG